MGSNSNSNPRYRGFLSYSHADRKFARKLHSYLEDFKVPANLAQSQSPGSTAEKLGSFFMDREELPSAPDLSQAIREALSDSEFLIVLCSPDSANSEYVNREVLEFKRMGRADRILCIIAEDVAASANPGEDCFCPALKFDLDEGGEPCTRPVEPIAADARRSADGYKGARLKLVAGLLGVGYDGLRQRELQRHNRRLVGIAGASIAGMLFTIGLSMIALDARDTAERHREEADKLIGFMLGDLRSRLDEVGRLDILDSVVEKTISYFQNLPADELNERTRVQRSAALTQLGQVKDAKGDSDGAKQLFTSAHQELVEMCGASGQATDKQCIYELGQAQFWLANGYWLAGENDQAMAGFSDYADSSRRLAELEPDNQAYQMELAMSYNNLAVLHSMRGKMAKAFELNARAIGIGERLLADKPADLDIMLMLAGMYSWGGALLHRDLQLQAALEESRKYLGVAREGLLLSPKSSLWLDHEMRAHRDLGRLDFARGLYAASVEQFRASLDLANRLVAIEPANQYWQIELAVIRHNLVRSLLASGDLAEYERQLAASAATIARGLQAHPDDIDWQALDFTQRVYHLQGLIAAGQLSQATAAAESVLALGNSLVAAYPKDVALIHQQCELLLNLGALEDLLGDKPRAVGYAAQAAELLDREIVSGNRYRQLELAARMDSLSGVPDEANPALQALSAAGYTLTRQ